MNCLQLFFNKVVWFKIRLESSLANKIMLQDVMTYQQGARVPTDESGHSKTEVYWTTPTLAKPSRSGQT